jgi:hypothetical protein
MLLSNTVDAAVGARPALAARPAVVAKAAVRANS